MICPGDAVGWWGQRSGGDVWMDGVGVRWVGGHVGEKKGRSRLMCYEGTNATSTFVYH